jgi:hypothetical protein
LCAEDYHEKKEGVSLRFQEVYKNIVEKVIDCPAKE